MNGVEDINQLINYQPGSVVSREILRRPGGTITLFAFDQGQGLSEHTTPFNALIIGVDGEADITVSSNSYLLKSGQMILLPAGQPHSVLAATPFKMLLIMINSGNPPL